MTGRRGGGGAATLGAERFRLGQSVVADPLHHNIVRDGRTVGVEPRVMQLLTYFAARPRQIVSKEELRKEVWGTHVVDEAVHRAISLLRSALGDSPRQPTIIETLPRHGYRLLVIPAAVGPVAISPMKPRALGWAAAIAGVAALGLLGSPGWRSGRAPAPGLATAAPQQSPLVSRRAPQAVEVKQTATPRAIATAPKPPATRPGSQSRTPAAAPLPPASAAETRAPGLAPMAPQPGATVPGDAPASRPEAPVAE